MTPPKRLLLPYLLTVAIILSVTVAAATEFAVKAPLVTQSLLLDASMAGSRLVAVGERGHIIYSNDAGDTWQQAQVPTRAMLTGVFFIDQSLGWAVGHDAVILKSTDGAATWQLVHNAPEEERPLLDIWFKSPQFGIAIGAYGYFLTTTDGGNTWSSTTISEDDWHLNQLAVSENGTLYIAAEAGMLYRSQDNGASWSMLPSPYEGSFFGAVSMGKNQLLVCGLRGHLFRTEDDGDNWIAVETGTQAMLNGGLTLSDGRVVLVGLAGTVLISSDRGKTVSLFQQPDRKGISAALPLGNDHLILFGEAGVRRIFLDN
ncbi:MAG: hypothetical protein JRH15_03080 [Deltaproteobacteria bacterium]|nr:hypothetical protein [Deltaproteobacteria bacterium]